MTTTEVGELLSVHPSTVKRWCNDGELPFHKTDGGHRRIRLSDTLAFAEAHHIPTILAPFSPHEPAVWAGLKAILTGGSYREVHDLALAWLAAGDLELIKALFVMLGRTREIPLAQLFDDGVAGFMWEVGDRWGRGTMGVAQEHLASQAVVEALSALSRTTLSAETLSRNGGPPEGLAVVGSMEGDQHHIGSLCIRVLLEAHGWRVAYLGPDVPLEEFAALQERLGAELVCISFTPPHAPVDVERALRMLGRFYRPEHPYALAVGGAGVDPSSWPEDQAAPFRALGTFRSCASFVDWIEGLPPSG